MNKKIVSALLCGAMVLATATPALAGEADGRRSRWLENQQVMLSSRSQQHPLKKLLRQKAAKLRWFIRKLLQQTRRSRFLTT